MLVADYIIDRIAKAGCDTVFGVYGAANGALIDAFHRVQNVKFIAMQHEACAGFAAEGYAKTLKHSHPFGVAISTSGPGVQNFVTPCANAYYDSVPVLFISGQVNSAFMGDGSTRQIGFQETPATEIFKPITKAAFLVKRADDIGWVMDLAMEIMHEGRPGPVLLDIPQDIQRCEIDPAKLDRNARHIDVIEGRDLLAWASECIGNLSRAKRPALLIGGGCRATDAAAFAGVLGIPAFPTWNALDIITDDSPCFAGRIGTYGGTGFNRAVQATDFLLCLGTRISGRITGANPASFAPNATIYAVDIDEGTCGHLRGTFAGRINVFRADVSTALGALRHAMSKVSKEDHERSVGEWTPWLAQVIDWSKLDPVLPSYFKQLKVHPYAFMRTLAEHTPSNAVVVVDCGGNLCISNHSFRTRRGQTYFSSNGNSPMGFAIAGAIGAHYADTTRPVIAVTGDGGFQINVQELQTIKHNNIPLRIILINNERYGITSQYQRTNFNDRQIANGTVGNLGDYSVPDFREICKAYGVEYHINAWTETMRPSIETLMTAGGPQVLEVFCPGFDTYLPRIAGAKPIDQCEIPT